MVTTPRRMGKRPTIEDREIEALLDDGFNNSEIARHFTDRGRPITQQGVSLRVKKIRENSEDRSRYILPWVIRTEHAHGWVYRAVRAYAKWRRGDGAAPAELKTMRELEAFLTENDAVITYDYNAGFQLRDRRPDDDASMIAKG